MVQLQINYLDWLDAGIQAKKCYEIARKHDKLVVVMETIKGGNLIHLPEKAKQLMNEMHPDWSYAYWAIAFCASLDTYRVLSGMSTVAQVRENTQEMLHFRPLNPQELDV